MCFKKEISDINDDTNVLYLPIGRYKYFKRKVVCLNTIY